MRFIQREEWGAPATSPAAAIASTKGVKVHYLGSPYSSRSHSGCNTEQDYVDIAYNALVCEHGDVFEGRGAHKRTGANGNQTLNLAHYAVCALLGSSGLTRPTDLMLHGLRDAIEWLRREGDAGGEIKGHKDGWATACPGGPLYDWVQRGAPRPGTAAPAPLPVVDLSRLVAAARTDPARSGTPVSYACAKVVEAALAKEGLLAREYVDGHFGSRTVTAYARWQARCGYSGSAADGIPGKTTLTRLGRKHGFTVKD